MSANVPLGHDKRRDSSVSCSLVAAWGKGDAYMVIGAEGTALAARQHADSSEAEMSNARNRLGWLLYFGYFRGWTTFLR